MSEKMKNVFRKLFDSTAILCFILIMAGCATERPADISLDELKSQMAQAMDPAGEYRRASAYYQRQNITESGFFSTSHQLLEVRFQRPDKFKLSYYHKNKVATEIISSGDQAWLVDHRHGKVTAISGEAHDKLKLMQALGHPDTDYGKLFSNITLSMLQLEDDRWYYKMICQPILTGSNPIIVYVDKATMLPKRMEITINTPQGKITSVSDVEQYQKFGTLNIPVLTRVKDGSREYTTRVVGYQLNAAFLPEEFNLPEFDPVLLENTRQSRR
ncbi:MAG: hypothetical protein E7056_03040 [Lentisphaerae bacterium]|nr:hypothetical protein [Lentisphaerota bacterium]